MVEGTLGRGTALFFSALRISTSPDSHKQTRTRPSFKIDSKIVRLVEQMLDLHKRLVAATSHGDRDAYQRQIDATDHEIDKLVYELYGLTEEEVRVVEGKEHPTPSLPIWT